MARTDTLPHFLTDVADAIRTKKGTSETILASDFDTEIENLPSGGDYNVKVDTTQTYASGNNGGIKRLITEVGDIDTSSMSNMNYMFSHCTNLRKISSLDTSNATSMDNMFEECSNLISIPSLDTANVTSMYSTFKNCYFLTSVPRLDINRVTNASYMFNGCRRLTTVSFDNTNICSPNSVANMFNNCQQLTHIDIRSFDFSNTTSYTSMFGASATNGVPDDCEIIVADDTQKTWITDKFTRLTNVKTVAEYEAEQNA